MLIGKGAPSNRCYTIAEIGINHNGCLDTAKSLIQLAHNAGFDCVKFQKRTIDVVYTKEELDRPRESPFGTTNRELKNGLEFTLGEYKDIDSFCRKLDIDWTASPWDEASVDFLMAFNPPFIKIASASATDKGLLQHAAKTGKQLWISTGGCDIGMIKRIVKVVEDVGGIVGALFHCNSTYPCETEHLNLRGIQTLNSHFPDIRICYSGHETGVYTSVMAAVLGACAVERHVTLDRAMYGSDQAASLEPQGMVRLIKEIRAWEAAQGDGVIRIEKSEIPIMEKLRRKNTI